MSNLIRRKNLDCFQQFYPELAKQIQNTPIPQQQIRVERAKNDSPVLCVNHSGQVIPFNDLDNPTKSARDWVKNLGASSLKNGHVLLVGVGTGYHPMELLLNSDQDTLIWIVEPEIQLLAAAIHVFDFTALIQSKRVRWLVGLNNQQIIERLFDGTDANRMRAQGIQLAVHQPISNFYQQYIQSLSNDLSQAIQFDTLKFNTEELQGKELLKNAVDNLPNLLQGYPMSSLLSSAAGLPVWVIAPGPSLEREIEQIKEHQDQALIIAVDTANRILQKHEIYPDIVLSIDFTELNTKHFDKVDPSKSILVSFVGVKKEITDLYIGKTYFFIHSANRLIQSIPSLQGIGQIEAVGSTSHAAYLLARMMGCSPIILIGNDLSFPKERWYAEGAMQLEIDQPNRESEQLLEVMSNSGEMVKTNALYKIYLDEMNKLIPSTGGNVINTSMQGARIEHTSVMSFSNCIQSYCSCTIDKSFIQTSNYNSYQHKHSYIINELVALEIHCGEVKENLLTLQDKAGSISLIPRKFQSGITNLMKELQSSLQQHAIIFSLTIPLCTRSTINLFGNVGQSGFQASDSVERNGEIKEKLVAMIQDFIEAIEYTAGEIARGIRLLKHQ